MPQSVPPNLLEHPALSGFSAERLSELRRSVAPMVESVRAAAAGLPPLAMPAASPIDFVALPEAEERQATGSEWSRDAFRDAMLERTSAELCTYLLGRIDAGNERWNAFSKMHGRETIEQASRADMSRSVGIARGPLHGVPIAVKDNIAVQGWPHTASSLVLKDAVAASDATVITRLRHSGAVLLGQTVMHELAFGMTTINPHLGAVRNPWDPRRICGGSSGGSAAAVAAGLAPAALGSDTGGSVRCPAALCGIAGFKPSFGAVRHGVVPLGYSLDTVGPLAKTAAQCLAIHEAIAGADPLDDATLLFRPRYRAPANLKGLRIGLPRPFFADSMQEGVRRQVNRALERLQKAGAKVENVSFPDLGEVNNAASLALLAEAATVFGWTLRQGEDVGADVRGRFEQGLLIAAADYHHAQRLRAHWKRQVAALFDECDLLLTPASPVVAPLIDDPYVEFGGQRVDARTALSRYLRSINFLGLPALVLPCGTDDQGLPVAVQLIGAYAEDEFVLQAGVLVEPALEFTALPAL
ncbi:MAG: amidase [Bryobacterales bacterium]|nr:amidase [Bryobacterales bacterium]